MIGLERATPQSGREALVCTKEAAVMLTMNHEFGRMFTSHGPGSVRVIKKSMT